MWFFLFFCFFLNNFFLYIYIQKEKICFLLSQKIIFFKYIFRNNFLNSLTKHIFILSIWKKQQRWLKHNIKQPLMFKESPWVARLVLLKVIKNEPRWILKNYYQIENEWRGMKNEYPTIIFVIQSYKIQDLICIPILPPSSLIVFGTHLTMNSYLFYFYKQTGTKYSNKSDTATL